jgi:hypothetical protein
MGQFEFRRVGDPGAVGGITLGEQCDLPALDLIGHALHCRGDVVEQPPLLSQPPAAPTTRHSGALQLARGNGNGWITAVPLLIHYL